MGAEQFQDRAAGKTAQEAFDLAVSEAQWCCGHDGYTGTVAECDGFVVFDPPHGVGPEEFMDWISRWKYDLDPRSVPGDFQSLVSDASKVYWDKWGPAVCIPSDKGTFLFCGLASC